MTTPEIHPQRQALMDEALEVFSQGRWRELGITDGSDLRLRDRIASYAPDGVPESLVWQAARVWERNKERIVDDWEAKIAQAWADQDSSVNRCETCPNCGCPGME